MPLELIALGLLAFIFSLAFIKQKQLNNAVLTCPKCGGTESYKSKIRVIKGIGGIYGNRQQEVFKPFCRSCDIEMYPSMTKKP